MRTHTLASLALSAALLAGCGSNPTIDGGAEVTEAEMAYEPVAEVSPLSVDAIADLGSEDFMQAIEYMDDEQLEEVYQALPNTVYFELNSTNLNSESMNTLSQYAEVLKRHTRTIEVIGHTDSRGTAAYNTALGQNRAIAVNDYLVMQGIAPERIKITSYGEEQLESFGKEEASHALNRRAVVVKQ